MALVVIGFPCGVLANAAQTCSFREYVRIVAVNGEFEASRFLRAAMLGVLVALTALLGSRGSPSCGDPLGRRQD